MPTTLENPAETVDMIAVFLRQTLKKTGKEKLLVAVSGGIDSAVVISLAVKAVGQEKVHALQLPYKDQSVEDSSLILDQLGLASDHRRVINIEDMVDQVAKNLGVENNSLRRGNIMARVRMIAVFDLAKQLDALVCGTENKSEKYLGYFTRFGDEASDIEPIQHLYKTQVKVLARQLQLPPVFLQKAPSAGLWADQTDEKELGFSYEQADQVLVELIDGEQSDPTAEIKEKVKQRIISQEFKRQAPYRLAVEST